MATHSFLGFLLCSRPTINPYNPLQNRNIYKHPNRKAYKPLGHGLELPFGCKAGGAHKQKRDESFGFQEKGWGPQQVPNTVSLQHLPKNLKPKPANMGHFLQKPSPLKSQDIYALFLDPHRSTLIAVHQAYI